MLHLTLTEDEMEKLVKVVDLLLKKTGLENLQLALEANNILAKAESLQSLSIKHAEEFHNETKST